jgi:hypothetical protein
MSEITRTHTEIHLVDDFNQAMKLAEAMGAEAVGLDV